VAQGVTDVFGIVGSAYMDALDIFPAAGIRFIPVAHEQGAAHMADGYARVSGRHGVCIGRTVPASPTSSPRSPPPTGRIRRSSRSRRRPAR
jgi:thiamine pyrophosphate-dependent acetolactate synthase large subunit-like protein